MNALLFLFLVMLIDALCAFLLVFWAMRGEQVFRNRLIIIRAISRYRLANTELFGRYEVDYTDMRSKWGVYFRFWDGGYKHILSPDKYAVVAPYIREEDAYVILP